jgi:hypothetical protein
MIMSNYFPVDPLRSPMSQRQPMGIRHLTVVPESADDADADADTDRTVTADAALFDDDEDWVARW